MRLSRKLGRIREHSTRVLEGVVPMRRIVQRVREFTAAIRCALTWAIVAGASYRVPADKDKQQ